MLNLDIVLLIFSLIALTISTMNLIRYFPIWYALKTVPAFIVLSLPIVTWGTSLAYTVEWIFLHTRAGEESFTSIIVWRIINITIIIAVCCFQLLILVWRPKWFRKKRKTD